MGARVKSLKLTEAVFQSQVRGYAKLMGWKIFHNYDARRSDKGWPDLTLVRGNRLVFAELKTDTGKTSPEQEEWLAALQRVAVDSRLVGVYLWRPNSWAEIQEVLR